MNNKLYSPKMYKLNGYRIKKFEAVKVIHYTCKCGDVKGRFCERILVEYMCGKCKGTGLIRTFNGEINETYKLGTK